MKGFTALRLSMIRGSDNVTADRRLDRAERAAGGIIYRQRAARKAKNDGGSATRRAAGSAGGRWKAAVVDYCGRALLPHFSIACVSHYLELQCAK